MEIRALREADDRARFRSGNPDLDRFFHQFAGQNQFKHHLGVTYVAVEGVDMLGYVTVAPGHLAIDEVSAATRKRLPRYPLPVLRLARLAVDERAAGQGLGERLLRFVMQLALRMTEDYGCAGLVVDAKPEAEAFYARYGFVALDALEGRSDARPQPTPMFLALRAILLAR